MQSYYGSTSIHSPELECSISFLIILDLFLLTSLSCRVVYLTAPLTGLPCGHPAAKAPPKLFRYCCGPQADGGNNVTSSPLLLLPP